MADDKKSLKNLDVMKAARRVLGGDGSGDSDISHRDGESEQVPKQTPETVEKKTAKSSKKGK